MNEPDGRVARHRVADLLTDEMRARVAAATFEHGGIRGKRATIVGKVGRRKACPIGVALGVPGCPGSFEIAQILLPGDPLSSRIWGAIIDFTELVDSGRIGPDDVKPMLGVIP